MDIFKNYLKDRTVGFYIALGVAVLTLVTAILYAALLGHLTDYLSGATIALLIVGPTVFAAASLFRFDRVGTAVMAILTFIALLLFAGTIYELPIEQAMVGFDEFPAIIVCAGFMLICVIISNVCAWLRMQKKNRVRQTADIKGGYNENNA